MAAKTRSKTRSTAAPKGSRASTKSPTSTREKPVTKRALKPETSRKRARNVKPDPETPSEPSPGSLMRLPLELIIEIAKQIHPFNLVLLSRTNKYFRHHLMSRSTIKIWQSSLRTVEGLPPCPDDICEPQYAALLFVGECSTCGAVTPRTMDPLFLVRLCAKCSRKQIAHMNNFSFASVQLISNGSIIPARRSEVQRIWCLSHEAKAIETVYKRLLNRDRHELSQWVTGRLVHTQKRYAEAQSLREWAEGKELDGFKSARKADIETRLVKLGWQHIDFQSEEPWRQREWTSLVYNAKPMDDQVWDGLFPRLLEHLEANRHKRLKKEAAGRESARIHWLYWHMVSLRGQLKPLVQAKLKLQATTAGTNHPEYWCLYLQRLRCLPLFPMFPRTGDRNFCPESTALIQTDMSMETFTLEFPAKAAQIPQLIDEARSAFERHLVQMLPNDTQPVDSQGTEFDLVAGTHEDAQPLNVLPLGTRKLLRADVVFQKWGSLYFYPSEFSWHVDTSQVAYVYDPDAASLARSLLHALGRPNASYLEMKALGRSFVCGRCKSGPCYYTWKDLIEHYQREASEWQRQSEQVARNLKDGETFTLVFTHDTRCIDTNEPLVRLVHEWINPGPRIPSRKCKLCDTVGISCIQVSEYIADHVRDVHLINDPVEGVHYDSLNS